MSCQPTEVPVKTKVDVIDVNGNIVINGTPGCAQSATPDGKVRVLVPVLMVSGGAPYSMVVEIQASPAEIVGR